ncbi:MAG: leucine-rich repeat protein [Clostridia bacterium]|nr:leucine-rich repeat protein [Clostridia bacterium]
MKRLLSVILCLAIISSVISLFPITVSAETVSGTCGDDLTWEYDSAAHKLTISGTGDMSNYSSGGYDDSYVTTAPWREYYNYIISAEITQGVTSIGVDAFYGCETLTSVAIPESVGSIGRLAFYGCTDLESITIDPANTVYHTSDNCIIETETNTLIKGCKNSVIPSDGSVTSIEECAFSHCSGLTSITIPDRVTSIGVAAFDGCSDLTSVTIPDSVTTISGYTFFGCSSLDNVVIPESVESIENWAFYNCISLSSITIPGSVESIGSHAFYGCGSLASVTIPRSVESISFYAFSGCTSLADTYYLGTPEEWADISIAEGNEPLLANVHYVSYCDLYGHDYEVYEVVPPTQTEEGYTVFVCARCGEFHSVTDGEGVEDRYLRFSGYYYQNEVPTIPNYINTFGDYFYAVSGYKDSNDVEYTLEDDDFRGITGNSEIDFDFAMEAPTTVLQVLRPDYNNECYGKRIMIAGGCVFAMDAKRNFWYNASQHMWIDTNVQVNMGYVKLSDVLPDGFAFGLDEWHHFRLISTDNFEDGQTVTVEIDGTPVLSVQNWTFALDPEHTDVDDGPVNGWNVFYNKPNQVNTSDFSSTMSWTDPSTGQIYADNRNVGSKTNHRSYKTVTFFSWAWINYQNLGLTEDEFNSLNLPQGTYVSDGYREINQYGNPGDGNIYLDDLEIRSTDTEGELYLYDTFNYYTDGTGSAVRNGNIISYESTAQEAASGEVLCIDDAGHDWVTVSTVAATCTSVGYDRQQCTKCGLKQDVEVTVAGHIPGDVEREYEVLAACTETGYYEEVTYCNVCGEELYREAFVTPALGHEPDSVYTFDVQPTADTVGYKSKHCVRCGTPLQMTAVQYVAGDTDGDGIIGAKDIRELKKYLAGLNEDDTIAYNCADVDGDGIVTSKDIRELKRLLVS